MTTARAYFAATNMHESMRGMSALAQLEVFYGEDDPSDADYIKRRKRRTSATYRRKRGQKVRVAKRPLGAHNTPCTGCSFAATCRAKALACNHFAEWAISKRPIPDGIKKLLPSKKWMALMTSSEHVEPLRAAYYEIVDKQTGDAQ